MLTNEMSLTESIECLKSFLLCLYWTFLSFFVSFHNRMQECESSLKHKSELLTKLESQKETMGNAIAQLEKKYVLHLIELNEKTAFAKLLFKFM